MALEYFLYTELYNNTLIDRSMTTFAPLPADTGQILIDFLIPETQPLYLYKEDAGLIVGNDDATVEAYLTGTAPPPQPDDDVIQSQFTGYTATTKTKIDLKHNTSDFNNFTGTTLPANYYNKTQINSYSATTLTNINSRVFRSGDTMTGTLNTTGNLLANGAVTGSSLSASVLMTTPILNASTRVTAPIISGSTCVTTSISCATTIVQSPVICGSVCSTAPITCATTRMQAPIVCATTIVQAPAICGNSYVNSPIISGVTSYAGSCLCSLGTTRLVGATTIGSTLNVGGSIFGAQSISGTSIYGSVSMLSPIVQSISCLCSQGTTRLDGAATAASTLNVSGNTVFGSQIRWDNPTTGGTLNDYGVKWDPISKQLRTIPTIGSSANVYCYASSAVTANNATDVNTDYIARTWSLSAGYYEAEFNAIFGNTSANRCATVCFLINGSIVGSCNLMKTNDGTVQTTAYVTQNQNLSGGTHQVQIVYRAIGGGISQVHYGAMRVQKIGETL